MGREREIIEGAIALIDRPNGWMKEKLYEDNFNESGITAYCLSGALEKSSQMLCCSSLEFARTATLVAQKIKENYPWCGGRIPLWNDHPKRTKAEVIAMLEKTAADCLE